MNKFNKWVSDKLYEYGYTEEDLRIRFKWKKKRYYVIPFNILWWILQIIRWVLTVVMGLASIVGFYVLMCLLG